MTNMRELGLPVRKWVPNWLALISIFGTVANIRDLFL